MAGQDMTGLKFGLLTVLAYSHTFKGAAKWFCICKCKGRRICDGADLRNGRVEACKSCAKQLKRGRLVLSAKCRHPRTDDPDKLTAMLSDTGQRLYERWEKKCAALPVHVTKAERLEVLRELVDMKRF